LGEGTGSISLSWSKDPYVAYNDGDGDDSIAMLWDIGVINPGESRTIDFSYELAPPTVPIPAAVWLLGSSLVGLVCLRGKKHKKIVFSPT
jgi:hypothetical protein